MQTTLSGILDLPLQEKTKRGLLYTPAEIAQQPATWKRTLQIFKQHQARIVVFLDTVGVRASLENRPSVILIGAGTSDYISQALTFVLRTKWGCEVSAVASTDLLPNMEEYVIPGRRYLWISFSRSGDSPEGVAVLEQALERYPEIAHLVVTCNEGARMAELCEGVERASVVVLDDVVNDRSLAMTSSFTNMIVLGQCLAHAWSLAEYEPVLERLAQAGDHLLTQAAALAEELAARNFARVCFLGSGALASVAKESALKVLEMTAGQVKTMSETVLGLRHGPMAALDRETLLVCFVSGDHTRGLYARDLLREIGSKHVVAERIAVGPASFKSTLGGDCDRYLSLEIDAEIEDEYRPVLDVIFGQLLGLYSSVAHQLKPDAPSPAGVIKRVVQKFQIY
ncbi:SIS domain-containing protein [Granulicella sp. L60]|uniref:SIS domain-containing protein n=1 Tax=Granulicella sp. L60 TaxID=1641866 RepID=UPI00131D3EC5|nr:SIS domain-containing protein [Granulicella sp. L60]